MSPKRFSLYEQEVASYINSLPNVSAERPSTGTSFSDVVITYKDSRVWLEVKMNHEDNLSNPRVFYNEQQWKTTYKTVAATEGVKLLNLSEDASKFVDLISDFSKISKDKLFIPTTRGTVNAENAVNLKMMKDFIQHYEIEQYILKQDHVDLGEIVTKHYTEGKLEPVYYMQAGDDFYRISDKDPLGFGDQIPLIEGVGTFKVRIGIRSRFYENQVEIKIKCLKNSKFSLKPGTLKDNPFSLLS